tara:strand:+ start:1263 stop:2210 length:948 start_codon:yes stop_codon:yes gene_type:complete
MDLENKIISSLSYNFSKKTSSVGIGDDCAYLKKQNLLISTDTFIEKIHFDLKKTHPKEVAHKFFCANYSDIQCTGGIARYCFLNISFPKTKSIFIEVFLKELINIFKNYKILLMGGDTTNAKKDISLTMTLIGTPYKNKPILRSTAKINDSVFTFSNIGFSKLGYNYLYKNKSYTNKKIYTKSIKKFLKPEIYTYNFLLYKLPITSCMDLSDGLINDLNKISNMSDKKIILHNIESINPLLYKNLKYNDYFRLVLSSAEEFTPIFTIPSSYSQKAIKTFKKYLNINLVKIGTIKKGEGIYHDSFDLTSIKTFQHF